MLENIPDKPLTAQESDGIKVEETYPYVSITNPANDCVVCGDLIDSARQIEFPGTDVCADHVSGS